MIGIRGSLAELALLLFLAGASPITGPTVMWPADGQGGLGLAIDDSAAGDYSVERSDFFWHFGGTISDTVVQDSKSQEGSDTIGNYREFVYDVRVGDVPLTAGIRVYQAKPVALFTLTYLAASAQPVMAFPDFRELPDSCKVMTFKDELFAPTVFEPRSSGGPWLIFDDQDDAAIVSPASHFFIQRIGGDGKNRIDSECNNGLTNIPAGFTQQTLVALGHGINATWDTWGRAMTDLQGKARPANDADAGLKYLGYWTDNGTFYYYNYDRALGYAGTLLALEDHFRSTGIPVGYFQLDSWWYYKTLTKPDGTRGKTKNARLPQGEWNRYGGLLQYAAHPAVIPQGLANFQRQLGLPLITHNRWIDPASPYHAHYKISGLAAVDPQWWLDSTAYLHDANVMTYEQDWLNEIYLHSPALSDSVDAGDEFLDGMAAACRRRGMSMQYCMAMPCEILQGSRYSNLTTIRTSTDRLKRDRWRDFLFTSRLASALGIWPWTDAYMSSETGNLILSDLSGGMVGFGDAMGKEDRANLLRAVRADGVIVKPDVPIVPTDSAYLAQAERRDVPLVASTYTDHDGIKTAYVLAFDVPHATARPATRRGAAANSIGPADAEPPVPEADRPAGARQVSFSLADVGISGPAYVYDYLKERVQFVKPGKPFTSVLGADGFSYYIVAGAGKSGIAFFGDAGKFVSNGRQRIATLRDEPGRLTADVVFAASEASIRLHGCSPQAPKVSVAGGKAAAVSYDPASQHFSVEIAPATTTGGHTVVVFAVP